MPFWIGFCLCVIWTHRTPLYWGRGLLFLLNIFLIIWYQQVVLFESLGFYIRDFSLLYFKSAEDVLKVFLLYCFLLNDIILMFSYKLEAKMNAQRLIISLSILVFQSLLMTWVAGVHKSRLIYITVCSMPKKCILILIGTSY